MCLAHTNLFPSIEVPGSHPELEVQVDPGLPFASHFPVGGFVGGLEALQN